MKKNLLRLGAMSALLVTSLSATAIDPPQIPAQVLTDGGKYVLMNKAAVAPCMYRTNWDGAFFYAGTAGSGNAVSGSTYFDNQLEAKKNEDSFEGFFFFLYLFIWLHRVSVAALRTSVASRGVFCCGSDSFVWLTPEHTGSVVASYGLSCSAACGILVP